MATAVEIPIPATLKDRPISKRGFLIPWFVAEVNGEPDFRAMDAKKLREAIAFNKCWMCGGQLKGGVTYPFIVGPMCIVNRISSEPPSHSDCARYAAMVCPFLTRPHARRREDELSRQSVVAGVMLKRNPGVAALVFVRSYEIMTERNGVLFRFGTPIAIEWYCEGRKATRSEVQQSIDTGLPELEAISDIEGPQALAALHRKVQAAGRYLPRV